MELRCQSGEHPVARPMAGIGQTIHENRGRVGAPNWRPPVTAVRQSNFYDSFVGRQSRRATAGPGQVLPLGISAHKRPFAEPISPKQSSTTKDQKVGTVGSCAAVPDIGFPKMPAPDQSVNP